MHTVILLTFLGAALAVPNPATRIVGGSNATIQRFPYMANMQYGWFGIAWTQTCGGTLITTNSVLSAAHCYDGDIAPEWRVVLGTSQRTTGGETFNVARFTFHPSYNMLSPLDADVVIVHLSTSAVFSVNINRAVIVSSTSRLYDEMPVTTIGWGDTEYQGERSETLQQVHINIINQQLCVQRYANLKTQPGFESWPDVTPGMACAGVLNVGGQDACVGDSGGPVIFRLSRDIDIRDIDIPDIVVGINSWSYRCAHPLYPSVFVRLPNYSDWIVANA